MAAKLRPAELVVDPLILIDPVHWEGRPIPPREWLWADWLPLGTVSLVAGDGGVGKTHWALQLIVHACIGREMFGSAMRRVKALGIFCEDDTNELHRRVHAINRGLDLDFADNDNAVLIARGEFDNLFQIFDVEGRGRPTAFYDQVCKVMKDTGSQLLILDTVSDFFGGNENVRSQVRQFIGLLGRLATEVNAAVVMLSHPSHAGREKATGESGSTSWTNTCRSRLYLEAGKAGPDGKHMCTLRRIKSNYSRPGDQLTLIRDRENDRDVFVLEGKVGVTPAGQVRDRADAAAAAFLAGLRELTAKKMSCNVHKQQAHYGPKMILESTVAGMSFTEEELRAAMYRLIREGRVASEEQGPKSRKRSFLVETAPPLPGVG